jgi:hypothetical protein
VTGKEEATADGNQAERDAGGGRQEDEGKE